MKKISLLKFVVIFISFASMGDTIIVPIVPNILQAFSDATPFFQNYLLSGTYLIAVVSALICGWLAQSISKKYLLIFAYVVFIISCIGLVFAKTLGLYVIFRSMMGITYGFSGACGYSLIASLFENEDERSSMIGWYNAIMNVAGVIFATGAGYIAVKNWNNAYYIGLLSIPIMIFIIFVIPKIPPEGKVVQQGSEESEGTSFPYLRIGILTISTMVFTLLFMVVFLFIAVYLQEQQLGDASKAGIMSSLITAGGFVSGVLFSYTYARLKRFTPVGFYLLLAICYFVLNIDVSISMVGIICFLTGCCYGTAISYFLLKATDVPAKFCAMSTAIISSALFLGSYLAPFVLNIYMGLFGLQTVQKVFLGVAITLSVCTIFSMIFALLYRESTELKNVEINN